MSLRPLVAPLFAASLGLALPAAAALPPFYDSGSQISVILGSAEIAEAVGNAPITGLQAKEHSDDGKRAWVVITSRCTLVVTLDSAPPGGEGSAPMVGPTDYKIASISRCRK